MNVIVNKKNIDTSCTTLAELVKSQGLPQNGLAVAVDNKMVKRTEWDSFKLFDGQHITILKAFCGG